MGSVSRSLAALLLSAVLACGGEEGAPGPSSFADDAAARSRVEAIAADIARIGMCTGAQLDELTALRARYPGAAEVREVLVDGLLRRGDTGAAIELLSSVPTSSRTPREDLLLVRELNNAGRYADALALAGPLREADPGHPTLLVMTGRALVGVGDHEVAIELLDPTGEGALPLESPAALYIAGLAHHHAGRHARAIELLRRCVARRPEHASAHYTLSLSLGRSGDAGGAQAHMDRFVAISEAGEARHQRSLRLADLSDRTNRAYREGRYSDCVPLLEEAMTLADPPLRVELAVYQSRVYHALGRAEEARAAVAHAESLRAELGGGR